MAKFEYHSLSEILPEGLQLAVHTGEGLTSGGILTVLPAGAQIVGQELVSNQELWVLMALLSDFPYHTSYDALLSALTGESVETCRRKLHQAEADGSWDVAIRPVRNILSRVRHKLQPLGINLVSIIETGYMLQPFNDEEHGQAS